MLKLINIKNQNFSNLVEKPEYSYLANAGLYIISKKVLKFIKKKKNFNKINLNLKSF